MNAWIWPSLCFLEGERSMLRKILFKLQMVMLLAIPVSRILAKETLRGIEALNRRGMQQLCGGAMTSANRSNKRYGIDSISSVGHIP
jgi:hypothetical protein